MVEMSNRQEFKIKAGRLYVLISFLQVSSHHNLLNLAPRKVNKAATNYSFY